MKTTSAPHVPHALVAFLIAFTSILALTILIACSGACSGAQRTVFTSTFAACEKGDVGQLVAPGTTVISDVTSIIEGNQASLESDLEALVIKFGIDTIECAVLSAEAVLNAAPAEGSGSGSVAVAVAVPRPGIARAKAYLAKRSAK